MKSRKYELTRFYIISTFLIIFWLLYPNLLTFLLVAFIPLAGMVLSWSLTKITKRTLTLGERIKHDHEVNENYKSPPFYIVLPSIAIMMKLLFTYRSDDTEGFIFPSLILFGTVVIFYLTLNKRSINYVFVSIYHFMGTASFLLIYSASVIFSINVFFDSSAPKTWERKLMSVRVYSDKGRLSYLGTVEPWGVYPDPVEIHISRDLYNNFDQNQIIHFRRKKGFLNIPWIEKKEDLFNYSVSL